jgi:hypothetical protein
LAEIQLKPSCKDMWYLPQVDAGMEDVLDLFAEPPDPLERIKLAGARLAASHVKRVRRDRAHCQAWSCQVPTT